MEQSKMGISIQLLGVILYITALANKTALFVLVFYVLVHEKNIWIRRTALKASLIIILYFVLTRLITSGDKILYFIDEINSCFKNGEISADIFKHEASGNVKASPWNPWGSDDSEEDEQSGGWGNWGNDNQQNQDDNVRPNNDLSPYSTFNFEYPYKTMALVLKILGITKNTLLVLLACMAFGQKSIKLFIIDSFIDAHVGKK